MNKCNNNMFSDSSNSDDSQVPETMLNSKSAFRVSVCLKRYYTDARARCYILVPRNRRVRWLQRRLRELFPLLVNFHLSTNGHMLPPSEPLALLTPEDAIDVIPYQELVADLNSNKDEESVSLVNNKRKGSVLSAPNSNKLSNPAICHSPHRDSNCRFLNSEKYVISSNCSLQDDVDGLNISPALEEKSPVYMNGNDFKGIHKVEESNKTQTLFGLKQQALALLESQVDVDTNTTEPLDQDTLLPLRRRRRIRKRKGQMQTSSQLENQSLSDFSANNSYATLNEPVPCTVDVAETSNPTSSPIDQSSTDKVLLSPQQEVARNDAICSRKPRLVHSLNC